ncbi:hypothetical protein GDO86_007969 [Hymenochirus boettgeri]|uniref:Myb-like, SWIRM and MPN domain-containing protein 1 n=1 Tax=Hymenochirus boettgeri TaxID=247094 RepID=A0A8T2J194_9PIPI|nr:hypothetical protein GDO86_007969 [Hymenochirus boettgeri]
MEFRIAGLLPKTRDCPGNPGTIGNYAEEAEVDVDIEGDVTESSRSTYDSLNTGFVSEQYFESVWKSEDVLTPWTLDNSISEENKAAIEKMLLEEEYYLSKKPLPANFWSKTKDEEKRFKRCPQKKASRLMGQSPSKPCSSPVKWTTEEKNFFEQGLATFGRRWTSISKLIGSRTVLQVKSYARHYYKNKQSPEDLEKETNFGASCPQFENLQDCEEEPQITDHLSALRGRDDPNLNAIKIEKLSDDEEIDITDEIGAQHCDKPEGRGNVESKLVTEKADICLNNESNCRTELTQNENSGTMLQQIDVSCRETLHSLTGVIGKQMILPSRQCIIEDFDNLDQQHCEETDSSQLTEHHDSLYDLENSTVDDVEELKPPDQEIEIDKTFILEEEKQAVPEFFEGRQAKTPDRYLRIRNYILDQWENCKPKYLNKTSVRPGLKNCGDVNCIGHIHTYLELIGAINFGCEQAVYNRPRPVDKTKCKEGRDTLEAYELAHRLQSMRTRRRRVRDPWGNWRDAKDLEGQTFEHLSAEELAKRQEEKAKAAKYYKGSRQVKSSFDPFQLIPCCAFTEEKKAPFQVKVAPEAMLILDLHAHVSMAEVIGLLGGRYLEAESIVEICAAEPCNSLSTGLQCEMDPVSQTQASEALASHGYSVIGWYHSHPAFDPNPSIRDIDTQAKYQNYFSRGGAKFLGMIISPYNRSNPLPQSQVSCLIISDELSKDGSYRIPYRFEIEYMLGEPKWEVVFEKTTWIIEKYRLSNSSVSMNKRFRQDNDLTCLQKLLICMRKTLENRVCPLVTEEFLHRMEDFFLTSYKSSRDHNYEMEENDDLKRSTTTLEQDCSKDQ